MGLKINIFRIALVVLACVGIVFAATYTDELIELTSGADVKVEHGYLIARAKSLTGNSIYLGGVTSADKALKSSEIAALYTTQATTAALDVRVVATR